MKPIGGIVTTKKSIPDSFRQLGVFTTDVLSQLWKVYFVNRDVIENGRRLENLFWRLWGSERTGRPFSGIAVTAMFMSIQQEDDLAPRRRNPRGLVLDMKAISEGGDSGGGGGGGRPTPTTPYTSSLECPPTPPPSPVPNSMHHQFASHSFLSKNPQLTEITLSLQRTLHNPPPSPPPPSPAQAVATPPPLQQPPPPPPPPLPSTLDTVTPKDAPPPASIDSRSSRSSSKASARTKPGGGGGARTEQLRGNKVRGGLRGGKKIARGMGAARPRGLAPPARHITAITNGNSPYTTSPEAAVDLPLPSQSSPSGMHKMEEAPRKEPQPPTAAIAATTATTTTTTTTTTATTAGGWIVDPDFRTKYIDKKQKQKEMMLLRFVRPSPATALAYGITTTTITSKTKEKGGRNLPVVDEVPLLKQNAPLVTPVRPPLPRQKSELTVLIENARKMEAEVAGGSAGDPWEASESTEVVEKEQPKAKMMEKGKEKAREKGKEKERGKARGKGRGRR